MAPWLHVLPLARGQALPAKQREGKAWLQPELAGGRAGGGQAGWGWGCPLAASGSHPACLPSLWLPSQPLPLQLLPNSPEQAPPAGPCRAATRLEWPLLWTCLRSSSPCWSTLCLGQRRGQVGTQVVSTGKGPKCPRGGSRHRDSGKKGCGAGKDPRRCVHVCHINSGAAPIPTGFGRSGQRALLTGAGLTWTRTGPECLQESRKLIAS